jgi:hypothetical protein
MFIRGANPAILSYNARVAAIGINTFESNNAKFSGTSFRIDSGTDLNLNFRQKIGEKIDVFCSTTASFCKKLSMTLVFEKNANFVRRKLAKIANYDHNFCHYDNYDRNIDLRSPAFIF